MHINKLLTLVVFVFSLLLLFMVFELKRAALVILLPLLLVAAVGYLGYAVVLAFCKEDGKKKTQNKKEKIHDANTR